MATDFASGPGRAAPIIAGGPALAEKLHGPQPPVSTTGGQATLRPVFDVLHNDRPPGIRSVYAAAFAPRAGVRPESIEAGPRPDGALAAAIEAKKGDRPTEGTLWHPFPQAAAAAAADRQHRHAGPRALAVIADHLAADDAPARLDWGRERVQLAKQRGQAPSTDLVVQEPQARLQAALVGLGAAPAVGMGAAESRAHQFTRHERMLARLRAARSREAPAPGP